MYGFDQYSQSLALEEQSHQAWVQLRNCDQAVEFPDVKLYAT